MLILGFDFGIKYIGVAIGQSITGTATPVSSIVVRNNSSKYSDAFKCIYDWSPSIIIVGYPLNEHFKNKAILKKIDLFIYDIRSKFSIPVFIVNENLSTWKAKKIMSNYKKTSQCFFSINALSAAILVEQWLFDMKC